MKKRVNVFLGVFLIAAVTVLFLAAMYFGHYYTYGSYAKKALMSTDEVTVTQKSGYIFFDGPGTDCAVIFYPGARVEAGAYAPLMSSLASEGFDCFIVRMPLHMAIFGKDRAGEILSKYDYSEYIMAGHSMGGAMAAEYVSEHPGDFSGLVLMGAYPMTEVPDGINFLSVIGSEDGIINTENYEKYRANWPKSTSHETRIHGGNHAGFGNYGKQDGDNDATIKPKTQWRMTVEAFLEFF